MRSSLKVVILCGTSLGWLAAAAVAQETEVEPITTDRPTVGQSPDLIPGGSFQIENGVDFSVQRQRYDVDLPESLLRVGLTNHLEARFLTSDAVYRSSDASTAASLQSADAALGAKVLLAGPKLTLTQIGDSVAQFSHRRPIAHLRQLRPRSHVALDAGHSAGLLHKRTGGRGAYDSAWRAQAGLGAKHRIRPILFPQVDGLRRVCADSPSRPQRRARGRRRGFVRSGKAAADRF